MIMLSDFVILQICMLARNMNHVFFIQKETTDVHPLARISHEEFIWIFILQMNESES
jgi:hypothetical protein